MMDRDTVNRDRATLSGQIQHEPGKNLLLACELPTQRGFQRFEYLVIVAYV